MNTRRSFQLWCSFSSLQLLKAKADILGLNSAEEALEVVLDTAAKEHKLLPEVVELAERFDKEYKKAVAEAVARFEQAASDVVTG